MEKPGCVLDTGNRITRRAPSTSEPMGTACSPTRLRLPPTPPLACDLFLSLNRRRPRMALGVTSIGDRAGPAPSWWHCKAVTARASRDSGRCGRRRECPSDGRDDRNLGRWLDKAEDSPLPDGVTWGPQPPHDVPSWQSIPPRVRVLSVTFPKVAPTPARPRGARSRSWPPAPGTRHGKASHPR